MDSQAWQANLKQSENTSLDLEFRQILCIIKHYIPYVNSNTRLSLYRAWLEKLSSTHTNKPERNKYLIELARQIKSDDLFPPFHERPPLGPLPCLPEIDNHPPIALDAIREKSLLRQTKNPRNIFRPTEPEQERNVQRQQSHDQFEKKEGEATIDKDPMENTLEDGSWCDLTDASTASLNVATMGSGDGEKSVNTRDCSENVKLETKIPPIPSNGKVDHFKSSEPTESRFPLKDTNFMSADWKKTIEGLQLRLTETLSQNNELKVIVDNLKANIKYESAHKDQLEMKLKRSLNYTKKK
ncbi:hypothetical protein JTB14_012707 [Gonioctena quinquepunctata]|nr:hypothetical protein JTB14_012707 [Gonioctena quinquepunctata]